MTFMPAETHEFAGVGSWRGRASSTPAKTTAGPCLRQAGLTPVAKARMGSLRCCAQGRREDSVKAKAAELRKRREALRCERQSGVEFR